MAETTFADPFDEDPEDGLYWDDLLEWETEQVFRDQEQDEDIDPDLYDQYEYMLEHQED